MKGLQVLKNPHETPSRPATTTPKKEEEPKLAARPWALQRSTTTVLQSVGTVVGTPGAAPTAGDRARAQASQAKARSAIAREARDGATEFAMALREAAERSESGGAVAGLDFDGFMAFIRRHIEDKHVVPAPAPAPAPALAGAADAANSSTSREESAQEKLLDDATLNDLRYFFSLLDRDGSGYISTAEFFALAIFESCEAAGYEAGIFTLLQLWPDLFKQGPVDQQAFQNLLLSLGFNHAPEKVVTEILGQAMASNWKRLEDFGGKVDRATGEDVLSWFRELIRPTSMLQGRHTTAWKHDGSPPSIRDLIHLLAHGHRVRDREIRAAQRERMLDARARRSSFVDAKLGLILPTDKDREDAAEIARYIRNEMSDDSVAGLLMKLQEWDHDGDRVLGLKELYRALSTSFDDTLLVPSPGAVQVLFDEMDNEGNGKVDFKELEEWFDAGQVRLRLALRRVRVFANLGEPNIIKLQQAMKEKKYRKGEWVFHQGDEGHTFYVILGGACDVLRTEEGMDKPVCLAKLGVGDFFGERSLLRQEVRYAGILATEGRDAKGLETMCISAEDFEVAMGKPLREMVPDEYA